MNDITIAFDLDGTLVDTAPDLIGATNHVLAGKDLSPLPAAVLRPWISYGARRMVVEALAAHGTPAPDDEVDRLLGKFLDYYVDNIAATSRPFENAVEVLERLQAAGARLAVCTNKREQLTLSLLDQLGLTHRFRAIAGRDTYDVHKPHPDHLLRLIADAGGDPRRAIMVGDSEVDIATAKAARIPVVAVTFGYTSTPLSKLAPDALIGHWRDLEDALARVAPP
jgi:phosphoglycolate phosphatase